MKVVAPTRLLAEAADVLEPFRDHVVVVGAAALDVALSGVGSVVITPTRDVDDGRSIHFPDRRRARCLRIPSSAWRPSRATR